MKKSVILILVLCGMASGCHSSRGYFEPFSITAEEDSLVFRGYTKTGDAELFRRALRKHSGVNRIILQSVPGSLDNDENTIIAKLIRGAGLDTYVPFDGVVSSGGTDLFLAGVSRQVASGACIGVHSWLGISLFQTTSGSSLPKDDERHQPFLDFYRELDIPTSFYWFALETPPETMHWMTKDELDFYEITTGEIIPSEIQLNADDCK